MSPATEDDLMLRYQKVIVFATAISCIGQIVLALRLI
jgi:hypothetical protein